MNLSGYFKKFGEGPDAGPVGGIIERTRAYLRETGLKENVVYVDEPNMEVYVTTAFGLFVVSSDEERRYVARLTPWQDVSGCSLTIGPTPESMHSITVTIEALEATLTERVGDSASPLIALFQECVRRSRPW